MIHLRRIASAALTLAVVVAAVVFWPAHLGGSTRMVLVSGTSMEPTYLLGDVVVVRSNDRPEIGDVVVFAIPEGTGAGQLVIHRIVDTDEQGRFITQGDNRDTIDQWPLAADDIVGTPILRLPYAGRIAMALGRFPVTSAGLGLIATVVLWPRRRHDEEPAAAEPEAPTEPDDRPHAESTSGRGNVLADDPWVEFDALLGLADDAAEASRPSADELLLEAQAWVDQELARLATDPIGDRVPVSVDDSVDEPGDDTGHRGDPDDRTPPSSGTALPRRHPRPRGVGSESARSAPVGARATVRTAWERLAERPLDELRFG